MLDVLTITNYFFNPHAIVPAFISLALVVIAILFIMRAGWTTDSITMLLLWSAIGIWFFAFAFMYSSRIESVAFWWGKAAYLGIPFIPAAAYHFTLSLVKTNNQYANRIKAMWLLSVLLCISAVGTPLIITGMHRYSWGYHPIYGPWGILFIGVFLIPLVLIFLHMKLEYQRSAPSSVKRKRLVIFMTAVGVGSFGTFDFLMNFHIALFPVGGFSIIIALTVIVVGIWRYQLVELTPSLTAHKIIDTMEESLFVLDRDGTIRLTNSAASRLTGKDEKEIVGRSIWEIFSDETVTSELAIAESSQAISTFESNFMAPDGQSRTLSMSVSIMTGKDGKLIAIVCIVRDITEEKQAEIILRTSHDELERIVEERTCELETINKRLRNEIQERLKAEDALRAREERYRTLFENSLDAIFILDNNKIFIDANPAAHALFVATRDEVIGESIRKFLLDSEMLHDIFREIDDTGLVLERELRVRDRFGKELVCILTASLWKNDNGIPVGYQGILRDVTTDRAAENELISYQ
jgi:PAS domain S-box-containing protein